MYRKIIVKNIKTAVFISLFFFFCIKVQSISAWIGDECIDNSDCAICTEMKKSEPCQNANYCCLGGMAVCNETFMNGSCDSGFSPPLCRGTDYIDYHRDWCACGCDPSTNDCRPCGPTDTPPPGGSPSPTSPIRPTDPPVEACRSPQGCYWWEEVGHGPGNREPCPGGTGNCDTGTAGDDNCEARKGYGYECASGSFWTPSWELNPENQTDLATQRRYKILFRSLAYDFDDCSGANNSCDLSGNAGLKRAGDPNYNNACEGGGEAPDNYCVCGGTNGPCTAGSLRYGPGAGGIGITTRAEVGYTNANGWCSNCHQTCDFPGHCWTECSCSRSRLYLYDVGNFMCPNPHGTMDRIFVGAGSSISFTVYTDIPRDIDWMTRKRLHDTSGGATNTMVYREDGGGITNNVNLLHNCSMSSVSVDDPNGLIDGVRITCLAPLTAGAHTATYSCKENCDVQFSYTVIDAPCDVCDTMGTPLAQVVDEDTNLVTWNNVPSATLGYYLRYIVSGSSGTRVSDPILKPPGITSHTDNTPICGRYSYQIAPLIPSCPVLYCEPSNIAESKMNEPSNLSATASCLGAAPYPIDISWNDNSEIEEQYVIQSRVFPGGLFANVANVPGDASTGPELDSSDSLSNSAEQKQIQMYGENTARECTTSKYGGVVDCTGWVTNTPTATQTPPPTPTLNLPPSDTPTITPTSPPIGQNLYCPR